MLIKEHELEVDVLEELEPYLDEFDRHRIRGNKLQSCSPFRMEEHPSFAVNLDNGTFIDSGSSDEYYHKGNLVKLLAYFMQVDYEEVESYLLNKYLYILENVDDFKLTVQLEEETEYKTFSADDLKRFNYRSPYLERRGIPEEMQRAFKIGYDKQGKAISIPWQDKNGNIINVKFRHVINKKFWYLTDGQPIKNHVYGLYFTHVKRFKRVFVVESEIDAMYLYSNGYPAIALGSASMNNAQKELILNSPIETLVLAFDNDTAGQRVTSQVIRDLSGAIALEKMHIPAVYKDVNDIPVNKIDEIVNGCKPVELSFLDQVHL